MKRAKVTGRKKKGTGRRAETTKERRRGESFILTFAESFSASAKISVRCYTNEKQQENKSKDCSEKHKCEEEMNTKQRKEEK